MNVICAEYNKAPTKPSAPGHTPVSPTVDDTELTSSCRVKSEICWGHVVASLCLASFHLPIAKTTARSHHLPHTESRVFLPMCPGGDGPAGTICNPKHTAIQDAAKDRTGGRIGWKVDRLDCAEPEAAVRISAT
jgi:hypothetical protein